MTDQLLVSENKNLLQDQLDIFIAEKICLEICDATEIAPRISSEEKWTCVFFSFELKVLGSSKF